MGAWWLGSLILAIIIFVFSLPLLFFPRSLDSDTDDDVDVAKEKSDSDEKCPDVTSERRRTRRRSSMHAHLDGDHQQSRAERMRPMLQRTVSEVSLASVNG